MRHVRPFHLPASPAKRVLLQTAPARAPATPKRSTHDTAAQKKQIPDTIAARGLTREQVIKDVLLSAQPTKEFVTVEEIAALALYLSGDMAKSITGAIISIDGGWTAA